MPIFYDVITLEDVDIEDNAANFYLLQLPNNGGFKLCATTQSLDAPHMKFDPETRITTYWPITREQIQRADHSILFPDGIMSNTPLQAIALDDAFRYDPAIPEAENQAFHFDASVPPQTFGIVAPLPPAALLHVVQPAGHAGYWQIQHQATQLGITGTTLSYVTTPDCLQAIHDGVFTLQQLTAIQSSSMLYALTQPACIQALRDGVFTLEELNPMNIHAITQPHCIQAIRDGVFTLQQLTTTFSSIIYEITHPDYIQAIHDGVFTLQQLEEYQQESLEVGVHSIKLCYIQAIRDGAFTLGSLSYLIRRLHFAPSYYLLKALQDGVFTQQELIDFAALNPPPQTDLSWLDQDGCIQAIQEGHFTLQTLLEKLALFPPEIVPLITEPGCMEAIRDEIFTFEDLASFDTSDDNIARTCFLDAILSPRCIQALRDDVVTLDTLKELDAVALINATDNDFAAPYLSM